MVSSISNVFKCITQIRQMIYMVKATACVIALSRPVQYRYNIAQPASPPMWYGIMQRRPTRAVRVQTPSANLCRMDTIISFSQRWVARGVGISDSGIHTRELGWRLCDIGERTQWAHTFSELSPIHMGPPNLTMTQSTRATHVGWQELIVSMRHSGEGVLPVLHGVADACIYTIPHGWAGGVQYCTCTARFGWGNDTQ